jgi:hydrogenase nickel incorporation protein HypA/HybF
MHEMGIASSILDAVQRESRRRPGLVPRKVGVRIGELSGVNPDALRFSFEILARESDFPTIQLEIQACPRRHLCPECDLEFPVIEFDSQCPRCGHETARCVSGDELDIVYLEMEAYESNTA